MPKSHEVPKQAGYQLAHRVNNFADCLKAFSWKASQASEGSMYVLALPKLPINRDPQVAFLQQGWHQIHVYSAPGRRIGDLDQTASEHLGPLLGPIGTFLTPVTAREILPTELSMIKLYGEVELTPIWNYNPSYFFDIPHFVLEGAEGNISDPKDNWLSTSLWLCNTPLQQHQLTALKFLRKNEASENNLTSLWNHPVNTWLHNSFDWSALEKDEDSSKSQGSILADDMGLGKTLTTLAYIVATGDSTIEFQWADWTNQSAATLVICPLATLLNWENEIKIHFKEDAVRTPLGRVAVPSIVLHKDSDNKNYLLLWQNLDRDHYVTRENLRSPEGR
ncbi:hypothetical protein PTTG_26963 [Puccinia triticina 1-1 BBBD Race 1]|uniref:SNF2_N domain-containing protein n=1 Tax=Puccinia triticina (isolate 1-1 / race 1 (BBBD)) TaxID=630390 RepID=A0A180GNQ3_PUCT1|nr:hypothetical protein PTTG_26963 [Puccinia triticina 1-1 BBBD Race 1]